MTEDREMLSVATQDELKTLKRDCRSCIHGKGNCNDYFEIQYPLSLTFPDGAVTEFATRSDLKTALRTFKEANTDATESLSPVFPIQVEQEEELITINSLEELQQMKEDCKNED